GTALFDTGHFMGTPVPLGEIQTDGSGRLLVLGGFGASSSPTNAPLTTFANNDGWHDDVSDGPVTAAVTLHGPQAPVQASGAWVICPPPRFAPPIFHIISLYDALLQTAVDRLGFKVPATPSFTNDVYPILKRAIDYQWVTTKIGNKHAPLPAVIPPPATADQRNFIFQALRDPAITPTVDTPHLMPAIWTDFFADVFGIRGHGSPNTGHWANHALTPTQYSVMKTWAAGNFINDWVGPPPPGTNIPPDGLPRAALENCSGGPFSLESRPAFSLATCTRMSNPSGSIGRNLMPVISASSRLYPGRQTSSTASSNLLYPGGRRHTLTMSLPPAPTIM